MHLGRTLNLYHVQHDAFGPVRKTFAQISGFKTPEGKLAELSANQLAGVLLTFCSAGSHSHPAEPLYLK